ncbi:hypothetical protein [Psychromonas sp. Urea-02u-13]|uniref:hypothetical protein n=1 Tax=Psychromonas sp. Urea-02u-13 TaxID=2058326 RepID=UPI000C322F87|nr:hypothetical protein [Psychromonas sp. Urea-02u-13]PKG37030.1 hypothetical protein CXF74_21060 [Psychromonas sp. Urea-02u-13]
MKFKLISLALTVIGFTYAGTAFSANSGLITRIGFSGQGHTSHPNVVQFEIAGGFSSGTCNTTYAAIRKEDSHLVSFALAAHMAKQEIVVYLDETDIYYSSGSRCTILFMHSK